MQETKAFLKGKAVGLRGKINNNPFASNTRFPNKCKTYAEWNNGWLAGRDIFLNGEIEKEKR